MFKYQNDNSVFQHYTYNSPKPQIYQEPTKKRSETHKHMTWHLFFKVTKSV